MSRTERLLDLLQFLRSRQRPVSGSAIAEALGVGLRTVYRDIATLQGQGARVEGAAGLGYVLRPGYTLPPLMFTEEEVEALVLGSRWVADRADAPLAEAARQALAKIAAVLPGERRHALESSALLIGPRAGDLRSRALLTSLRRAMRLECKAEIRYRTGDAEERTRTVWPIAIGFFDQAQVLVAWCEWRQAMRHFRVDRIQALEVSEVRYPKRRPDLVAQWRAEQGMIAADRN